MTLSLDIYNRALKLLVIKAIKGTFSRVSIRYAFFTNPIGISFSSTFNITYALPGDYIFPVSIKNLSLRSREGKPIIELTATFKSESPLMLYGTEFQKDFILTEEEIENLESSGGLFKKLRCQNHLSRILTNSLKNVELKLPY